MLKLRFRAKVRDGLKRLFRARKLVFAGQLAPLSEWKAFLAFLRPVCEKEWVVYAKAPFRGPDHLLHYLARYTHRVPISNHRLIAFDGESVTFRWKDYAHGNKKRKMTISADEFLRRFLLHTLPRGFVRIRFFGFLAGPHRSRMLQLARHLLEGGPAEAGPPSHQRERSSIALFVTSDDVRRATHWCQAASSRSPPPECVYRYLVARAGI